jgi:hypothetical protein
MENKFLETNIEIAKFACIDKYVHSGYKFYKFNEGLFYSTEDLKFHCSWDWIMPVLEKAQLTLMKMGLNCNVVLDKSGAAVHVLGIVIDIEYVGPENTKIETMYKSVLTLIRYIKNID